MKVKRYVFLLYTVHTSVSWTKFASPTLSLHCHPCENDVDGRTVLSGTPDVRGWRGKRQQAEPRRSGLLSRRRSDGVKRELFIRGAGVEKSFLIMA